MAKASTFGAIAFFAYTSAFGAALALMLSMSSGCGAFLEGSGAGDDAPPPPANASTAADSATATTDGSTVDNDSALDVDDGGDAATDAADGGPSCPSEHPLLITERPHATEVAFLGESPPTQFFPQLSICNMSGGVCLVRFTPSPTALNALKANLVVAMSVQLQRATTNDACGPTKSCTGTFSEFGTLNVAPVNPVWTIGSVSFLNRTPTMPWGTPGADLVNTDVATVGTNRQVQPTAMSTTVSLPPASFSKFLTAASTSIAVRTKFTTTNTVAFADGGSTTTTTRNQFVMVFSTADNTTPNEPPLLTIQYCE